MQDRNMKSYCLTTTIAICTDVILGDLVEMLVKNNDSTNITA